MVTTRSSMELVQAALDLIIENGIDTLTLSRVAARAGVSRATAYREFGDKDGLLSALAREEIGAMITAVLSDAEQGAGVAALVSSVVISALHYLRDHDAFTYVRDHEPHWLLHAGLTVENRRMNLVQTVAAMVAPAMADADELVLPPVAAAEVVVRAVLSHALMASSALTDREVADAVARSIVRPGRP